MARYEFCFEDHDDPNTPAGKIKLCYVELEYPMAQAPKIGQRVRRKVAGRVRTLMRVASAPNLIVKGETVYDWKPGEVMRTTVNGQDIRFQFVDHPHTDPTQQRNLAALAGREGISSKGLGQAYIHPKTGRPAVDVVSNTKDPLGKIEAAKRQGNVDVTTTQVDQSYKTRSKR